MTEHDGGTGLRLRGVPAGHITRRDARTATTREVDLLPFSLGATPVTLGDWHRILGTAVGPGTDPCLPAHPVTWFEAITWCNAASALEGLPAAYRVDGRHVEWDVDATGYRLPTEAEGEYACRAGSTGSRPGDLEAVAWTAADRVAAPQPVAGKRPNDFGLFDTLGNVWEWCWDFADTARYGEYRSLRGGGWADPSYSVRASVRRGSAPDARLEDAGFRIACGAAGSVDSRAGQGWSAAADARRAAADGMDAAARTAPVTGGAYGARLVPSERRW